jgi:hypothetical protein
MTVRTDTRDRDRAGTGRPARPNRGGAGGRPPAPGSRVPVARAQARPAGLRLVAPSGGAPPVAAAPAGAAPAAAPPGRAPSTGGAPAGAPPAARPARKGTGTTTRPAAPATPRRSSTPAGGTVPAADGARRTGPSISRTPFILLLVTLLGGGLICLLVVNTTLAASSFRISDLQRSNAQLQQRAQDLQQQVSTEEAPTTIEKRAYQLGLRPQTTLHYIDLQTGRRYASRADEAGANNVPGYGR